MPKDSKGFFEVGTARRLLLALAFLLLAAIPAAAASLTGRVVKVLDGDTIEVLAGGRPERIRLADIDCPEKGAPFGARAKEETLSLVGGKDVRVEVVDRDRYGRSIGRVFLGDGTCLNRHLVEVGLAWHYARYSRDPGLATVEAAARAEKRGLWADKNPVPPWEWRKEKRGKASRDEAVMRGAL